LITDSLFSFSKGLLSDRKMSVYRSCFPRGRVSNNIPKQPKLLINSINAKRDFSNLSKIKKFQSNASFYQKNSTLSFFITSNNKFNFSKNASLGVFSARTFATAPPKSGTTTAVEGVMNEVAKTPAVNPETVNDLTSALNQPVQHLVENLPVWETLKNSYLSWFNPGNWAEAYIETIHSYFGMPWWVSIIVAVLGVRTLLLPVAVRSARYGLIMKEIQPKISDLMLRSRLARQENNYPLMRQLAAEMTATYNKYGVSLFTGLKFGLIQAPIFLSFFWALRRMAEQIPGFTSGGWDFFTDLSAYDPYMRLPILSAVLFALSAEWGTENIRNTPNPVLSRVIMYSFAAVSIIVSRYFPMALHIYWCSSSLFSLIQMTLIKRTPLFKRWLHDWEELSTDKLKQTLFKENPLKKGKGTGVQSPTLLNKQMKSATKETPEKKEGKAKI